MSFLGQVASWLTSGSHWSGPNGIPIRLAQHLELTALVVATAAVVGIGLGIVLGHSGRGGLAVINLANIGRAVPTLALLILFVLQFSIGILPAYLSLVALAIPPVLTNSYTGVRSVDPQVTQAARAMGMTPRQVVVRVELPIAVPLIMAGLRTTAVEVVATATLAGYVAYGGLGRYIIDGLATQDQVQLFSGAVLVAALAGLVDLVFSRVQRALTSPGLRKPGRFRRWNRGRNWTQSVPVVEAG